MSILLVNKGKVIGKVSIDEEKPLPFMICPKRKMGSSHKNNKAYFFRTYKEAVSALTPNTQLWVFHVHANEYHPYTSPPPLVD